MPTPFSPPEVDAIARAVDAGVDVECPVCSVPLDRRPVPPRPDVSYVRTRIWLVCPRCHRTTVLDRSERR